MTQQPFKFLLAILCCLFFASFSIAQSGPTMPPAGVEITKAIPSSPDAAALGKYGSVPVSPYTGVPNISVPLYTIQSGGISLPISLSYHAGGNKVEEIASSVGLGWALNAGGAITRTIRGFADEQSLGFLDFRHFVPTILAAVHGSGILSNDSLNTYLNEIADGTMDGEADMYNFNFGNYSGRFVMDSYGQVTVIPQQKLKFTFTVGSGPDGYPMIMSFTAVAPDGVTYVFGSDNDGNNAFETTSSVSSCAMMPQKPWYYATSWFIKKITDPLGHEIDFTYNTEDYGILQNTTDTRYQFYSKTNVNAPLTTPGESVCNVINDVKGVKLSDIVFENGHVYLHASARNDVNNANLIDSLAIVNYNGFAKTFRLFYTNNNKQRLRLDSLIGYLGGSDVPGSYKKEKYSFQYNPDDWKSYTAFSQDYWGYNNGASNTTLLPPMIFTPSGTSGAVYVPGADRSSNESAMTGGMLNRITYPTGGHTSFTYEANRDINMPGGYSSNNLGPANYTVQSNDTTSYYNNYDNLHGNPNNLLTIFFFRMPHWYRLACSVRAWLRTMPIPTTLPPR